MINRIISDFMDLTDEQREKLKKMAESLSECKFSRRETSQERLQKVNRARERAKPSTSLKLHIPFPSLQGRSVYVTGTVHGYTKEGIKKAIEEKGGLWKSLSKSLDMLVIANKPGPEKIKKAREWNLLTIDIDEFLDWSGIPRKVWT